MVSENEKKESKENQQEIILNINNTDEENSNISDENLDSVSDQSITDKDSTKSKKEKFPLNDINKENLDWGNDSDQLIFDVEINSKYRRLSNEKFTKIEVISNDQKNYIENLKKESNDQNMIIERDEEYTLSKIEFEKRELIK